MPIKHEINGKAVRYEIRQLLTSLLVKESHFDAIRLHPGGYAIKRNATVTFLHFNLKYTEQKYIIAHFLKRSKYHWDSFECHGEGDPNHFGKTYDIVKTPESSI